MSNRASQLKLHFAAVDLSSLRISRDYLSRENKWNFSKVSVENVLTWMNDSKEGKSNKPHFFERWLPASCIVSDSLRHFFLFTAFQDVPAGLASHMSTMLRQEIGFMELSNVVFIVSPVEKSLLESYEVRPNKLQILSNIYSPMAKVPIPCRQRANRIIFVGASVAILYPKHRLIASC